MIKPVNYGDIEDVYIPLYEEYDRAFGTSHASNLEDFGQEPRLTFYMPFANIANAGFRIEDKELLAKAIDVGRRFILHEEQLGDSGNARTFEEEFSRFLTVQGLDPDEVLNS